MKDDVLCITPLSAAIVEAMPDRGRVKRIQREFRKLGKCPVSQCFTASEVEQLFRVSVKTVGRWGRSGAVPLRRIVAGHHRYRAADVRALLGLDAEPEPLAQSTDAT